MTIQIDPHRARHIELHQALDELVADMISNTAAMPSETKVIELMQWSHKQTIDLGVNKIIKNV